MAISRDEKEGMLHPWFASILNSKQEGRLRVEGTPQAPGATATTGIVCDLDI